MFVIRLINSAEKLFREGLINVDMRNEELAYVYFSRFMKLYSNIKSKYPTQIHKIDQRLSGEKKTSEKLIVNLRASLKSRHEKQQLLKPEIGLSTFVEGDNNKDVIANKSANTKSQMVFPGTQ